MKRILVSLLVLLSLSILSYSQDYERIGKEKNDVIKEFSRYWTNKYAGNNDCSILRVCIGDNCVDELVYVFDEGGYCDCTVIITQNSDVANKFMNYYDLKYKHIRNINYETFINNENKQIIKFTQRNRN